MSTPFREDGLFYVVKEDSYWWLQGHVVQRGFLHNWEGNVKVFWFKDYTNQNTCDGVYALREDDVEGPLTPLEVLAHLGRQEVA